MCARRRRICLRQKILTPFASNDSERATQPRRMQQVKKKLWLQPTRLLIASKILSVRRKRVMLDSVLAGLYGVLVKQLVRQGKGFENGFPMILCSSLLKKRF